MLTIATTLIPSRHFIFLSTSALGEKNFCVFLNGENDIIALPKVVFLCAGSASGASPTTSAISQRDVISIMNPKTQAVEIKPRSANIKGSAGDTLGLSAENITPPF